MLISVSVDLRYGNQSQNAGIFSPFFSNSNNKKQPAVLWKLWINCLNYFCFLDAIEHHCNETEISRPKVPAAVTHAITEIIPAERKKCGLENQETGSEKGTSAEETVQIEIPSQVKSIYLNSNNTSLSKLHNIGGLL